MRVAIYVRVSQAGQSIENQVSALREVGQRLAWNIVDVYADDGISGAKGREQRPAFDRLLRGVVRKDFDLVAAWSVCRIGRSVQHLLEFLAELHARGSKGWIRARQPGGPASS